MALLSDATLAGAGNPKAQNGPLVPGDLETTECGYRKSAAKLAISMSLERVLFLGPFFPITYSHSFLGSLPGIRCHSELVDKSQS